MGHQVLTHTGAGDIGNVQLGGVGAAYSFAPGEGGATDGTIATGSFNFSANATRNAENVLRISSADLADQYTAYIEGLARRYGMAGSPA